MTQTADSLHPPLPDWPEALSFLRTDRAGRVADTSVSLAGLLGWDPGEVIGQPFATLGAAGWPAAVATAMASTLAAGQTFAAYLPLRADTGERWAFTLMTPMADGVLTVHAPPADRSALREAQGVYEQITEAEHRVRADGGGAEEALAAGQRARTDFWGRSLWATEAEYLAAATTAQARLVFRGAGEPADGLRPGDPMEQLGDAIVRLGRELAPRLAQTADSARLAEQLRETSWGGMEVMGTLGRIAAAAVAGSGAVGDDAPSLVSTAKAAANLAAGAMGELETLLSDTDAARAALADLGVHLGTVTIHAELVRTAAAHAWPPLDPGPGTVPAAFAAELARLAVAGVDDLIARLAAARDALGRLAASANAAARDVARFHGFIGSWRLQVPRWPVGDRIEPHLATMDGRGRLATEHVASLRALAAATTEGANQCAAAGLFEPMNAIARLAAAARGPRGRHADDDWDGEE